MEDTCWTASSTSLHLSDLASLIAEGTSNYFFFHHIKRADVFLLFFLFLLQHYILAFGGIIAIPLILAEPLCIKDNNVAKSQLISTIFFVSGLCTLLQTTIGTR